MRFNGIFVLLVFVLSGCSGQPATVESPASNRKSATNKPTVAMSDSLSSKRHPYYSRSSSNKLDLPDQVWKQILTPELYHIAREAGTERAFTGKYWGLEERGIYFCAACGNPLFKSDTKFSSGCGWPSFFETVQSGSVNYRADHSYGMQRTEVTCGRCDAHLGHVFDDGPPPTGKRYCMNSISLEFEPGAD